MTAPAGGLAFMLAGAVNRIRELEGDNAKLREGLVAAERRAANWESATNYHVARREKLDEFVDAVREALQKVTD